MLSDSESETENVHTFTINEHYAKAFEYKKEREELEKLKAKYGSDFEYEDGEEDSDSDSDTEEDSDGEELTPAVDVAILRTLARIKKKDADIYDSSKNVFQQEQEMLSSKDLKKVRKEKSSSKPVTLRQVVLDAQLRTGSRSPSPELQTFADEQNALRFETIAAFHGGINEDEDDFLVPREKTKDELEREEEEYREFLEREVGKNDLKDLVTVPVDEANVLEGTSDGEQPKKKDKKKKKKKDATDVTNGKSKGEADQEFLMNYILNRGWIDRDARRIPTYGEITSSKQKKGKQKAKSEDPPEASASEAGGNDDHDEDGEDHDSDLSSEAFDDIVDRFESSYNFRFEEPDAATIKTYPRVVNSTVRREDSTRKDARTRKKERKEEQMQERREEVRRLKALKMKELRHKLDKIGQEGGKNFDDDAALQELDLEGDWDPSKHDEQMIALYGGDGGGEDDEDFNEKPVWDDDIDIGDIIPDESDEAQESNKKKKKKKKKKKGGDEEVDTGVDIDAMDADAAPPMEDAEEWDGTEEMRKRKLDEYMDEIYGLDFNDMVGDIPTRFKYVSVPNQNHGLSAVDILMSTDKELNEFMSVKKYAPYRTGAGRQWDSKRSEKLKELKATIAERTGGARGEWGANGADGEMKKKKRKGKKERMKSKGGDLTAEPADEQGEQGDQPEQEPESSKKDKKRKRDSVAGAEDLTPEGANGTSKKRKRKHKKKEQQQEDDD